MHLYQSNGTKLSRVITGGGGDFEFEGLPDGYYYLTARAVRGNELEPQTKADIFEAESGLIEIVDENVYIRNLYLDYIETMDLEYVQ